MKRLRPALLKLLGLCLIATLLLGTLPLSTTAATVDGTNLITDSGFDTTTAGTVLQAASGSNNPTKVPATWFTKDANKASFTETNGNKYLAVTDRVFYGLGTGLEVGKTYAISFRVMLSAAVTKTLYIRMYQGTSVSGASIDTSPTAACSTKAQISSSAWVANQWYTYTYYYQPTSDKTAYDTLAFVFPSQTICLDDVYVTEYTSFNGGMVTDGDFEQLVTYAEMPAATATDADSTASSTGTKDTWYRTSGGTGTIRSEIGGNKYAVFDQAIYYGFGSYPLTVGKSYTLKFKLKYMGVDYATDFSENSLYAQLACGYKRDWSNRTTIEQFNLAKNVTNNSQWIDFECTFTYTQADSDADRDSLCFHVGKTGCYVNIDAVSLTEIVPIVDNGGLITDGQFVYQENTLAATSGSANPSTDTTAWFTELAGDGIIKADGTNTYLQLTKNTTTNPRAASAFNTALTANKIYKITFKLKLADADTKPTLMWPRVIKAGIFSSSTTYKDTFPNSDGATGDNFLGSNALGALSATEWTEFTFYYKAADTAFNTLLLVANNSICIDDVMVTECDPVAGSDITTAYNNAVAIRTADNADGGITKQGMRIYNSIDKSWADENAAEYGSIAIREGYLESVQKALDTEDELTLDLYDKFAAKHSGAPGFGKGISYNGTDRITWETTDTSYIFTSYLTGIAPKYYGDVYLIRSYVKDKDGNIYYGDIYEQSVYNVVYTIRTKYSTDTVGMAAADAIIEEAKSADQTDSSVVTYAEWLVQTDRTDSSYTE